MDTKNYKSRLQNSVTMKVFMIFVLVIILMVPNSMIKNLIGERSHRKTTVEREVANSFGRPLEVTVPILTVPYTEEYIDSEDKVFTKSGILNFSPQSSRVNSDVASSIRKRSIFDVVVYNNTIAIDQTFDFSRVDIDAKYNIDWKNAYFRFGISDPNSISEDIDISLNNQKLTTQGIERYYSKNVSGNTSFVTTTPFEVNHKIPFTLETKAKLKGTKSVMLHPIGEKYDVKMTSSWPHPSFTGSKLPTNYDITEAGFESQWRLNKYAHNVPKVWEKNDIPLHTSAFGVKLIQPLDEYGKNRRMAKYALLIISLTFSIFFLFEILQKSRIHPIQYILVGAALTVFFLLLLSISEQIGFNIAYLISSLATTGLIVSYTSVIFKNRTSTMILTGLLLGLFAYLFVILQMQDLALLAGALALFAVLTALMTVSRKVNWYSLGNAT